MDELRVPARIVATALMVEDGWTVAALVMTEDSETTYAIREDRAGTSWIGGVLTAVGVPAWEELRGHTVYVLRHNADGPVVGLEHLATEPGGRYEFPDFGRATAEEATDEK